jgi:YesN/AraC family two-component response regulator
VQTLIVDDEEDMRVLVRATIEIANEGLVVAGEASNGSDALALWRTAMPDALIIDQRMPGMTGLELCEAILSERPDQRIILFSAYLSDELRRSATALGVSACLSKDDVHLLPETLWSIAAA